MPDKKYKKIYNPFDKDLDIQFDNKIINIPASCTVTLEEEIANWVARKVAEKVILEGLVIEGVGLIPYDHTKGYNPTLMKDHIEKIVSKIDMGNESMVTKVSKEKKKSTLIE